MIIEPKAERMQQLLAKTGTRVWHKATRLVRLRNECLTRVPIGTSRWKRGFGQLQSIIL